MLAKPVPLRKARYAANAPREDVRRGLCSFIADSPRLHRDQTAVIRPHGDWISHIIIRGRSTMTSSGKRRLVFSIALSDHLLTNAMA